MDEELTFGQWLRRSRKAQDLTQTELADKVSCALGTIRKLEADELRPSKELAARLATHFGVPAEKLTVFVAYARGLADAPLPSTPENAAAGPTTASPIRASNLPVPLTALIGRTHELNSVCALLRRADLRLLTLTGPGGAGKTRVALQVAVEMHDQFADGVTFVALATLSEPEQVVATIVQALGIKEAGGQPLVDRLQEYLRQKQLLLVLDNFEQVVAAAPSIAQLLAGTSSLKILITSRTALHLSGEHELPIPPLAQPDAVALFSMRAQAARPDFAITDQNAATVATICQRLDGLPLAIELAAVRIKLFPPQALLARLENRLTFLTSGARDLPARQQTIRNTIDWSYQLLDEAEKTLLRRLSVFVGGCTLEAAEAVCRENGDNPIDIVTTMAALVDQSLVRQEEGTAGEPCFTMLETIREYALERLQESGEHETLRQRHAQCFLSLVEQLKPQDSRGDMGAWRGWLGAEYGNLRAGLRWAIEQGDTSTALRLGEALNSFWWAHGAQSEARECYDALLRLSAVRPSVPEQGQEWASLRTQVLDYAGSMAWARGDFAHATQYAEERLALEYQLENTVGIAETLGHMGVLALWQGDDARAATLMMEALALAQTGERTEVRIWLQSGMLINLGNVAWHAGDYAQAVELLTRSLALAREIENQTFTAWSLRHLGTVACLQSNFAQATDLLSQSLTLYRDTDDMWGIIEGLEVLTWLVSDQAVQTPRQQAEALPSTLAHAARLLGATAALRAATGHPPVAGSQAIHERKAAAIRAALDEAAFAAAWAEGRAMTVEQAIAWALEGSDGDRYSQHLAARAGG